MAKDLDTARDNRDVMYALLHSGLPNQVEDRVLSALEAAGLRTDVAELLGNCQRNAVALRDELRQRDFDAIAVKGWVVDLDAHVVPRDFGEAVSRDVVHWWVEVQIDETWFTFDLASNDREQWGDLYIDPERPATYRPAEIEPDEMDAVRAEFDLERPRGLFDAEL